MSENLWPDFASKTLRAPVAIVKEQAFLLGKKTQNLIVARVDLKSRNAPPNLYFEFQLVAPFLGGYTLLVFTFQYSLLNFYPVQMTTGFLHGGQENLKGCNATNEEELVSVLRDIFNDPKTIAVIQALIAQSETAGS
jgi:hypothetical protein